MFSVYGQAGRLFSGSMEDLRQVEPISALSRNPRNLAVGLGAGRAGRRHLAGHAQPAQDDSSFSALLGTRGAHGAEADGAQPDTAHRLALSAYGGLDQMQAQRHPLSQVRDIMSTEVVHIADAATVREAWNILATQGVGQAPVLNAHGALVGLLSRADLLQPERLPGPDSHALVWQALLAQSVVDLMWTPVPAVAAETDIRRLARVLLDTNLPGLPVLDGQEQLVGFVSRSDILRAVVADPPLDLWS